MAKSWQYQPLPDVLYAPEPACTCCLQPCCQQLLEHQAGDLQAVSPMLVLLSDTAGLLQHILEGTGYGGVTICIWQHNQSSVALLSMNRLLTYKLQ